MKKFDFNKAESYIEKYKDKGLISATLGMYEDWWWTAEEVWNNDDGYREDFPPSKIGGIDGSSWATPSILLLFEKGAERMLPCHDGGESEPNPHLVGHGVLSGPRQDRLPSLEEDEFKEV